MEMEQHADGNPDEVPSPAQLQALLAALQQLTESLAPIKALAEKTLDKIPTPLRVLAYYETPHDISNANVPVSPFNHAAETKQYPSLQDITLRYTLLPERLLALRKAFVAWLSDSCICGKFEYCANAVSGSPGHRPRIGFRLVLTELESRGMIHIPSLETWVPRQGELEENWAAAKARIGELWPVSYWASRTIHGASYSPSLDGYFDQNDISGSLVGSISFFTTPSSQASI
ncbi:hypothetical protein B0T22DRAFT_280147 [Podospora appendiculata]|uniref:Uncharacterized protein n=1 Tax=Podospora appendiculata TaxID=314037 RepID=A0AAE0X0Z9_9PEZI|nr:hypothetical protein B0T22DRAFT_280147 [Podospora appendiculata]